MRNLMWSVLALIPCAASADDVTHSWTTLNRAYVFQKGDGEMPSTRITRGEGFIIIEQNSRNNHAIIIQSR